MKSHPIHRRQFLSRLTLGASAPLLGPLLEQIAGAADGKLPPLRFLFVVEGNSLPPLQVHPEGIPFVERENRNKFSDTPLASLKLPVSLQPVEAYRDRLTIVQGLSGRMCSGGHSSDHGTLGCYAANNGRNVLGATVDGVLGTEFPGVFRNVVLGISSNITKPVDFNLSASGPGRSLATIYDPKIAYSRLFGSVADGKARGEFVARQNILDHMRGDIKKAQQELGGIEKEKLDTYLESFESLGTRSRRLVELHDKIKDVAPTVSDKFSSLEPTDQLDAHFAMATASLIGGLTHCATIASGVGFPNMNVTFRLSASPATSTSSVMRFTARMTTPRGWNAKRSAPFISDSSPAPWMRSPKFQKATAPCSTAPSSSISATARRRITAAASSGPWSSLVMAADVDKGWPLPSIPRLRHPRPSHDQHDVQHPAPRRRRSTRRIRQPRPHH